MSVASRNPTVYWCEPIHHVAEGPTDPSNVTLHHPFVVVVLGSSRGIGRATAIAYAQAGASGIVLTGRSEETLSAAVLDVRAAATNSAADVLSVLCDVCSDTDLQRLESKVKEQFERIDVLVINAGVATRPVERPDGSFDWPRDIGELDLADFRRTFDVNFFAVVGALKHLLPLVEAAGVNPNAKDESEWRSPQSVVVVTSSSIHHYDPKLMAMGYSLSKYTAARMSEYVHEAHKDKGICSFAIQPGSVLTGMFKLRLLRDRELTM
jgi:NAD(P)-dependent dehydrogenase (short-subunit alcohol dehydrogenase family)